MPKRYLSRDDLNLDKKDAVGRSLLLQSSCRQLVEHVCAPIGDQVLVFYDPADLHDRTGKTGRVDSWKNDRLEDPGLVVKSEKGHELFCFGHDDPAGDEQTGQFNRPAFDRVGDPRFSLRVQKFQGMVCREKPDGLELFLKLGFVVKVRERRDLIG